MKPTHRRAIGMTATVVVLFVYAFFAASVGGLFADKSTFAQISFFAVAGIAWVFPLYPIYKWMRGLSAEEAAAEKPPEASVIKRK